MTGASAAADVTRRARMVLVLVAVLVVPVLVSVLLLQAVLTVLNAERSVSEVLRIAIGEQLVLLALLVPIVLATRRLVRASGTEIVRLLVHLGALCCLVVLVTAARWTLALALELPMPVRFGAVFIGVSAAKAVAAYGVAWLLLWALGNERRTRDQQNAADALAARERTLRAQVTEARLAALQNRLQPHFLFNALNAIGSLILTGSAERAHEALTRLSAMLRHMLAHADEPTVPLRTELASVGDYLAIEQLRFGDRLAVRVASDPDCGDALVPAMLLVPLVENAIRHGVGRRCEGGAVAVRATRRGAALLIEVEDDGAGQGSVDSAGFGLGLRTCRERLESLYGGAASLEIATAPNGAGTRVTLCLPCDLFELAERPEVR